MPWIIAIPILVIVAFAVYTYMLLPRMKARAAAAHGAAVQTYAESVRGREDAAWEDALRTNASIRPIADAVGEPGITGIISCQEKREMKDFLRQQATEILGRTMKKITKVGFREVDNTEYYYLALTAGNLHYLHFSLEGALKQHLTFPRAQMQELEVGKVTGRDMVVSNASLGDVQKLSFIHESTLYRFFFYDNIWGHPLDKPAATATVLPASTFCLPSLSS